MMDNKEEQINCLEEIKIDFLDKYVSLKYCINQISFILCDNINSLDICFQGA